jgi:hypothetical protein
MKYHSPMAVDLAALEHLLGLEPVEGVEAVSGQLGMDSDNTTFERRGGKSGKSVTVHEFTRRMRAIMN